MTHNNHGFTIIEVILALIVVSLAFMPIAVLQNVVIARTHRFETRLKRLWKAEQFLYVAREKRPENNAEFSLEEFDPETTTRFLYTSESAQRHAQLQQLEGLIVERVVMTWKEEQGKPGRDVLVALDHSALPRATAP